MKEKKIDVVIIGGSSAGLACADSLIKAGLNVLMLEASQDWHQKLSRKLLQLSHELQARGGEFLAGVPVIRIRPGLSGRGFHIKTGFNYIHAHYVVMGTSQASSRQLIKLARWHKAGLYQIARHSNGNILSNMAHGRQTAKALLKDRQQATSLMQDGGAWLDKRLAGRLSPRQLLHKQMPQ